MKALTVRQPWAWAIIYGGKDIENRTWTTTFRGSLAIHAGGNLDPVTEFPPGVGLPAIESLPRAAIIGVVELVDILQQSDSVWFEGPFGWVFRNPRPLREAIPSIGHRGVWDLPSDIQEILKKDPNFKPPDVARQRNIG